MEFLETNKLPKGIGPWAANQHLWDRLRDEALFFGLDGLVKLLSVTFSCSPDDENGIKHKGILYWLGTKKGTMGYLNPLERGEVWVAGCMDYSYEDKEWFEGPDETEEKAYFFQYRPNLEGEALVDENGVSPPGRNQGHLTHDDLMNSDSKEAKAALRSIFDGGMGSFILSGCDACRTGTAGEDPVVISFKNGLAISPTHYSIRNAACYGMSGDWDFSGSVDGGKTWRTLHRQRGKTKLYGGVSGDRQMRGEQEEARYEQILKIRDYVRSFDGMEARKEAVCDYFEEHQRHTFKLDYPSADFFTHFRFISVQTYTYDRRNEFCLHGIGFEIYGEVREELGGRPPDSVFTRVDELESKNAKLENQLAALRLKNDRLESNVKYYKKKLKEQEG